MLELGVHSHAENNLHCSFSPPSPQFIHPSIHPSSSLHHCSTSLISLIIYLSSLPSSVFSLHFSPLLVDSPFYPFHPSPRHCYGFYPFLSLSAITTPAPSSHSPLSLQIENAMFLNKMKEQLGPEKAASFPHSSSSHYPTAVLTVPGSVAMDTGAVGRGPKQEGGGGGSQMAAVGAHLHPPHTSQNITVVPVPSTGIMTAGQWPPPLWGSPLLLYSPSTPIYFSVHHLVCFSLLSCFIP